MDHHELTAWLNRYLNVMAQVALRHGGTLDKFIGDAVMVFFGDPESAGVEEDALACVRMALEMQAEALALGVDIRIGICSGECTVGNFGSSERMDYTIIGRVVNTAARLEHCGEAGRVLISALTYERVKAEFAITERNEIDVKGIKRRLMTYWVDG